MVAGEVTGEARLAQIVVKAGVRRAAATGDLLLREGAEPDRVLVLLTGRVKVTASTLDPGRSATVAVRGPGTLLGEISTLAAVACTASVVALEPVRYVALAASRYRQLYSADPANVANLTLHLRDRLVEEQRRRVEQVARDAPARLAARLVEIAGPGSADAPLTQYDLADLVGASLKATASALRTLREAGWIETHRGRVVVLDRAALSRRAVT